MRCCCCCSDDDDSEDRLLILDEGDEADDEEEEDDDEDERDVRRVGPAGWKAESVVGKMNCRSCKSNLNGEESVSGETC